MKKVKQLVLAMVLVVALVMVTACGGMNLSGSNGSDSLNSQDKQSQNNDSESQSNLSSEVSNSQSEASKTNSTTGQSQTQSATKTATQTQSASKSNSQTQPKPVETDDDAKILNFVKTASDVGTAKENAGTANSSTANYADVPDFYVNVTEPKTGDFFASPSGSSSGDGSQSKPYDLNTALKNLKAGNTLFLLEGTYKVSSTISVSANGTRKNYIKIYAFNNKRAVLDFSSMTLSSSNRGVELKGKYVNFYGIDFKGAGDNGMCIGGHYNIIDNCCFYNNRDSGLQISSGGTNFSDWAHDNLIRNCTSFNNHDADGENADGFACKLTNGNNNTFDGCISYANSDDGWDLFAKVKDNGRTIMLNCIAFANGKLLGGAGTAAGDCNGFKLGSNTFSANNYLENCMAFDNYQSGFTANGNKGAFVLKNCTGYNNARLDGGASNFRLYKSQSYSTTSDAINCLSLSKGSINDNYSGSITNSLLYSSKPYFIQNAKNKTNTAFSSDGVQKNFAVSDMVEGTSSIEVSDKVHSLYRNPDNTINLGNYLKVKTNAEITTMGVGGVSLGADLSKSNYFSANGTVELINAIGSAQKTSESYKLIYKAAKSFASLSANEKTYVSNVKTLINAINVYSGS